MKVSANDERGDPICTYIYTYKAESFMSAWVYIYLYIYIYMCVCVYPCVYAYVCEYSVRALIYSVTLSLYCPEIDRN